MSDDKVAIDTAWKIHGAQVDWTGKVDSKASFALAIQSGVMVGVIGLTGDGRRLSDLDHDARWWFAIGAALLIAAIVCVAWVVRPRLRSWTLDAEVRTNFIYFGHLRKWNAEELEQALRSTSMLPVLSRQLIAMSKIAWFKHRLLQVSMTLALFGTALIGLAAFLNT